MSRLSAGVVVVLLVSCGSPGVAPTGQDGGAADTGVVDMTDAGVDSGSPLIDAGQDAGAPEDAGIDAGEVPDAGTDAGAIEDGGSEDAGTGTDGGEEPDAGSTDAGPPCGNGVVDTEENCDLGAANGTGLGCSTLCQFECTADADCSDNETCNGNETCVSATVQGQLVFACQPGTNASSCTPCASGYCDGLGRCNASTCGDGCIDPNLSETCDFGAGNNLTGSGCEPTCVFSCATDPNSCDDGNVCNGTELCAVTIGPNASPGQSCVPASLWPPPGTSCGGALVCEAGACVPPPSDCGNGIVETDEDCDLGTANGTGQGCNGGCHLDCTQDSDCADQNLCNGAETCDGVTVQNQQVKVCHAGTNASHCTVCPSGFCDGSGACAASSCGDGCLDENRGESCDFGSTNNVSGSGCEPGCTVSCSYFATTGGPSSTCDDLNVCNGAEQCVLVEGPNGSRGQACTAGTIPGNGTPCGPAVQCVSGGCACYDGACVSAALLCGNGVVDIGEDCDLGADNGAGKGCDATCHLDCVQDSDCNDQNLCNGTETCVATTEQGQDLKKCQAGTNAEQCTVCPSGLCDGAGACVASRCGDSCIDANRNEQCDFGPDANVSGSGCEPDCSFSCVLGGSACNDQQFCNGVETCAATVGPNGSPGQACAAGTFIDNGTSCGTDLECNGGACVPTVAVCGDGQIEHGEDCDLGAANGTGIGCSADCYLDCAVNADCDDGQLCNGSERCVAARVQGQNVKVCSAGTNANRCTTCPTGVCDGSGACASSSCGDGCIDVSRNEQCDFGNGNNLSGSGCEPTCTFSCALGSSSCSDGQVCNGQESCAANTGPNGTAGQACVTGTNAPNGTTCGADLACLNGGCVSRAVLCGNSVKDLGEDCDLGSENGTGKGCDTQCHYDCARDSDCSDGNTCNGAETCVSVTELGQSVKKCQTGTNLDKCSLCSTGLCDGQGRCLASTCGDGCMDSAIGEQCDFGPGANVSGSGCETDCSFSCVLGSNSCNDGLICNGVETCAVNAGPNGTPGQACLAGTAADNGTVCDTNKTCQNGSCVAANATCGNGVVETGEDCDLGTGTNGTGQGCSAGCLFDCAVDSDCSDGIVCNGAEACVSDTVSGQTVKKCSAGTAASACTACPGGFCDGSGACKTSSCGDGCLDTSASEQCDDGNHFNLDGCDSSCKYEVVTRMTTFAIQGTVAPSFCSPTTNALGTKVLSSTALGQINPPLQTDVDQGSVNILTQLLGLDDLTGVTDANGLRIGLLTGKVDPALGAWTGTSPMDWWFLVDPTTVSNGLPTGLMSATLSNRILKAGPNDVSLVLSLGGSPATLRMRGAQISASVDSPTSVPAPPPDQLDPSLSVFQTITASGSNQGLCGNITVASLAQIPIPEALTTGTGACSGSCSGSKAYTYCGAGAAVGPNCNSLLDAMVGGCKVIPVFGACLATVITATQPDVPATPGGMVTRLSLGSGNKVPASQTTNNSDAYSSYIKFNANRAHITGSKCSVDTDCQTGQTCSASKVCQ